MIPLLNFPGHRLARCRECVGCLLCDGGLALCERCGGAEASLPTDCPGHLMPAELEDAVLAGEADFCRRDGWTDTRGDRR